MHVKHFWVAGYHRWFPSYLHFLFLPIFLVFRPHLSVTKRHLQHFTNLFSPSCSFPPDCSFSAFFPFFPFSSRTIRLKDKTLLLRLKHCPHNGERFYSHSPLAIVLYNLHSWPRFKLPHLVSGVRKTNLRAHFLLSVT